MDTYPIYYDEVTAIPSLPPPNKFMKDYRYKPVDDITLDREYIDKYKTTLKNTTDLNNNSVDIVTGDCILVYMVKKRIDVEIL